MIKPGVMCDTGSVCYMAKKVAHCCVAYIL